MNQLVQNVAEDVPEMSIGLSFIVHSFHMIQNSEHNIHVHQPIIDLLLTALESDAHLVNLMRLAILICQQFHIDVANAVMHEKVVEIDEYHQTIHDELDAAETAEQAVMIAEKIHIFLLDRKTIKKNLAPILPEFQLHDVLKIVGILYCLEVSRDEKIRELMEYVQSEIEHQEALRENFDLSD